MERRSCACGSKGELRLDDQPTAFGPRFEAVCQSCYSRDVAERRAEGKRLHYRPRIVAWERLEIVQPAE
jgi:hypothetical protein